MSATRRKKKTEKSARLPFSGRNYALFAIGIVLILLGFVILGTGDITISPILLVLGYCVFIPAGILLKSKPAKKGKEREDIPG